MACCFFEEYELVCAVQRQHKKRQFLEGRPVVASSLDETAGQDQSQNSDMAFFHKFFEVKAKRQASGQRLSKKRKVSKSEQEPASSDDDSAGSEASSEAVGKRSACNCSTARRLLIGGQFLIQDAVRHNRKPCHCCGCC